MLTNKVIFIFKIVFSLVLSTQIVSANEPSGIDCTFIGKSASNEQDELLQDVFSEIPDATGLFVCFGPSGLVDLSVVSKRTEIDGIKGFVAVHLSVFEQAHFSNPDLLLIQKSQNLDKTTRFLCIASDICGRNSDNGFVNAEFIAEKEFVLVVEFWKNFSANIRKYVSSNPNNDQARTLKLFTKKLGELTPIGIVGQRKSSDAPYATLYLEDENSEYWTVKLELKGDAKILKISGPFV